MADDEDAYKRQFSRFIKNGITADGMEDMYKKAHAAIRTDPEFKKKAAKPDSKKRWTDKKLTYAERKAKVNFLSVHLFLLSGLAAFFLNSGSVRMAACAFLYMSSIPSAVIPFLINLENWRL